MAGTMVYANCHLSAQPCRLSVPQASFFPRIAEASIHVPTRRTNAQLSASGTLGAMNVGLVLCFPNAVSVLSRTQVLWEAWRQQTAAVTAGPISASKFSTVPVAFQVDPLAQPGTVTLYLGANRGCGQTYPNGDIANVVASRSEAVRVLGNLL